MDTKIRYTAELTAREGTEGRIKETLARMATDERLSANAKQRTGNVKMEKWWSVVAGLLLVVTFILYSFYLTIPALILLGVLIIFLIYIGISLKLQQKSKESAEFEISPRRSADAMIRTAIGMPISGRDVTAYMDKKDIAEFGSELRRVIECLVGEKGPEHMEVTTSVKVTEAEERAETYSIMPVEFILDFGEESELVLNYSAPFAMAPTGDCILADAKPIIGEAARTEIKRKAKH